MSMPIIHIIGVGADGLAGLRPELVQLIRSADFLAGGERHLPLPVFYGRVQMFSPTPLLPKN